MPRSLFVFSADDPVERDQLLADQSVTAAACLTTTNPGHSEVYMVAAYARLNLPAPDSQTARNMSMTSVTASRSMMVSSRRLIMFWRWVVLILLLLQLTTYQRHTIYYYDRTLLVNNKTKTL